MITHHGLIYAKLGLRQHLGERNVTKRCLLHLNLVQIGLHAIYHSLPAQGPIPQTV